MPVLFLVMIFAFTCNQPKSYAQDESQKVNTEMMNTEVTQDVGAVITEPTPLSQEFYCDQDTFTVLITAELVDGTHEYEISGNLRNDGLLIIEKVNRMEWGHEKIMLSGTIGLDWHHHIPYLLIRVYEPILYNDYMTEFSLSMGHARDRKQDSLLKRHIVIIKSWKKKLKSACSHQQSIISTPIFSLEENWTLLKVFLHYQ